MEKKSEPVTCPLCKTQGVAIKDLEDLQDPIGEIEEIREEKRRDKLEDAFEAQYGGYLKPYRKGVFWKRITFSLIFGAIFSFFLFRGSVAIQDLKLFDVLKLMSCFLVTTLLIFNNTPFFRESKEEKELRKSSGL